jgi:hypothetical protein
MIPDSHVRWWLEGKFAEGNVHTIWDVAYRVLSKLLYCNSDKIILGRTLPNWLWSMTTISDCCARKVVASVYICKGGFRVNLQRYMSIPYVSLPTVCCPTCCTLQPLLYSY